MKQEAEYRDMGGDKQQDKNRLERIWDEVQALNRAAGPWGAARESEIDNQQQQRRAA